MFTLLLAAQAGATELCTTETAQPDVRRYLEKQARKLLAPDAVDEKSLWFCGHGGLDAEAVIESMPRRLPDGSDLVRPAWCQRYDADRPAVWKCAPVAEYRKTDITVKLHDVPARFTVVLAPEATPALAQSIVERALTLSAQVTEQNRCAVTATPGDLRTFNSDFTALPTAENSSFTLYHAPGAWQVNRKVSSVTLVMTEGGEPRLTCWAAARDAL
jgi:hypothetical protein